MKIITKMPVNTAPASDKHQKKIYYPAKTEENVLKSKKFLEKEIMSTKYRICLYYLQI